MIIIKLKFFFFSSFLLQDLPIYDVPEEPLKVEVVELPDSILKEPLAQVRQGVLGAQSYYNVGFFLFLFL